MKTVALYAAFFALALTACTYDAGRAASPSGLVGGSCSYESHPGVAEVLSVKELPPERSGGQRLFEVRFFFSQDKLAQLPAFAADPEGGFLFLLDNTQYPNENDLAAYGLMVGAKVRGVMKVIVRGTCTPVLFDFPRPVR